MDRSGRTDNQQLEAARKLTLPNSLQKPFLVLKYNLLYPFGLRDNSLLCSLTSGPVALWRQGLPWNQHLQTIYESGPDHPFRALIANTVHSENRSLQLCGDIMKLQWRWIDEAKLIMSVEGTLDRTLLPEARRCYAGKEIEVCIMDLQNTRYMDSGGIESLKYMRQDLIGIPIYLQNCTPRIRALLKYHHLDEHFLIGNTNSTTRRETNHQDI